MWFMWFVNGKLLSEWKVSGPSSLLGLKGKSQLAPGAIFSQTDRILTLRQLSYFRRERRSWNNVVEDKRLVFRVCESCYCLWIPTSQIHLGQTERGSDDASDDAMTSWGRARPLLQYRRGFFRARGRRHGAGSSSCA